MYSTKSTALSLIAALLAVCVCSRLTPSGCDALRLGFSVRRCDSCRSPTPFASGDTDIGPRPADGLIERVVNKLVDKALTQARDANADERSSPTEGSSTSTASSVVIADGNGGRGGARGSSYSSSSTSTAASRVTSPVTRDDPEDSDATPTPPPPPRRRIAAGMTMSIQHRAAQEESAGMTLADTLDRQPPTARTGTLEALA